LAAAGSGPGSTDLFRPASPTTGACTSSPSSGGRGPRQRLLHSSDRRLARSQARRGTGARHVAGRTVGPCAPAGLPGSSRMYPARPDLSLIGSRIFTTRESRSAQPAGALRAGPAPRRAAPGRSPRPARPSRLTASLFSKIRRRSAGGGWSRAREAPPTMKVLKALISPR